MVNYTCGLNDGKCIFSVQQNNTGHIKWFFAVWAIGIIPMWAIVSRYSRNLSADGLLYDFAITLIYRIS